MNINDAVMEMKSNFVGSIMKIENNWYDYYKDVSDGQNAFEMALHDIGYFKLYTELVEEGIDEEVKDDLFDLFELDFGGFK